MMKYATRRVESIRGLPGNSFGDLRKGCCACERTSAATMLRKRQYSALQPRCWLSQRSHAWS